MSFSFALIADVQHADKVHEYACHCCRSDHCAGVCLVAASATLATLPPSPSFIPMTSSAIPALSIA